MSEYIKNMRAAYQQVQEKLKGDQHKLDHDKDGDIDGDDFAKMRKKKKMDEAQAECPKCKGEGCDHCDNKGYHKVAEDEEVIMNPKKKKEKGDAKADDAGQMAAENAGIDAMKKAGNAKADAEAGERKKNVINAAKMYMKDSSCSYEQAAEKYGCSVEEVKKCTREMMKKENTQWPIYQRIMEKTMQPDDKAADGEEMVPNKEGDHISKAAQDWIKDHEGKGEAEDNVDVTKVMAKNEKDMMRTVPAKKSNEVDNKAVTADPMKKPNKEA